MLIKKINLLNLNPEELRKLFSQLGEKSFRANQVMKWIYHNYLDDFEDMTNLSVSLRKKLSQIAEIRAPIIKSEQRSIDGTRKWLIKVDNQLIETIYIPDNKRATLCLSSQIGCNLGCNFCATGQQGFNRNLQVSEIVGQVWKVAKIITDNIGNKNNFYIPISHIVFMGMGEPLLNLTNVVSAIKIILNDYGFGLSKNRVTLSTAGVVPGIDKLKNMIDVSLAISLHAPNDIIRNKIMPINHKYNIDCLLESVNRYLCQTTANRKYVTIEYVLLNQINDKIEHAHELAKRIVKYRCKVNLIPWNAIAKVSYKCSSKNRIYIFHHILTSYGIIVTIRKTRGIDINAACGQLVGSVINRIC